MRSHIIRIKVMARLILIILMMLANLPDGKARDGRPNEGKGQDAADVLKKLFLRGVYATCKAHT